MTRIPLAEFAAVSGQTETAKMLGVTQGALSKAIRQGRKIFVYQTPEKIVAEEVRPFPCFKTDIEQGISNE